MTIVKAVNTSYLNFEFVTSELTKKNSSKSVLGRFINAIDYMVKKKHFLFPRPSGKIKSFRYIALSESAK